jgi:hypothetical protein
LLGYGIDPDAYPFNLRARFAITVQHAFFAQSPLNQRGLQCKQLAAQLHETEHELNLTPEHIENVIRVGLELAGQPALIAAEV